MRFISTVLIICILSGCTTFRPIEMSSVQLQEGIAAGKTIKPSDTVKIVTTNGENHVFKVTAVTKDSILGNNIEIPLMDITSIEKLETEMGKTTLLILVSVFLLALIKAASNPLDGAFDGK